MIDPKAESHAESMGSMAREASEPRDANPYVDVPVQSEFERELVAALAEAWWRGWDQADASWWGKLT